MSHCDKCCHRHRDNCVDYRYCLYGTLVDNFLYSPPIQNQDRDPQEVINLKNVGYIRRCHIQNEYGHLENKGVLFQLKSKAEIQVNYSSEKQAESEYNVLIMILSRL